jgi:hypothetical protein
MVTNAEEPEPAYTSSDKVEEALRVAIAGHPRGSVRRIILYAAAFALMATPFPLAAGVPLALLLATDQLV